MIKLVYQPENDEPVSPAEIAQATSGHPADCVCDDCLEILTAPDPADLCSICGYQSCQCAKIERREAGQFACSRCGETPCQCRTEAGTLKCACGAAGKHFVHREDVLYEAYCDDCYKLPSVQAIETSANRELLARYNFPAEALDA